MKIFLAVAFFLAVAIALSVYGYLWATSEILLAHGVVTSKRYEPEHFDYYSRVDSEGHFHMEQLWHPAEFWVSVRCPERTFTMESREVYERFREGARVKLTYLSKVLHVKRVYGEDEPSR